MPDELSRELFPAHAGMNRLTDYCDLLAATVPRTRGDEPLRYWYRETVISCSPHTRG